MLRTGGFLTVLVGAFVPWAIGVASARADVTINVNTTADETTPRDGACSLREAIVYANGGTEDPDCASGLAGGTTTINLPPGHYVLGSTLRITRNTAIKGGGASATIIDANGSGQVIMVAPVLPGPPAVVSITGVTVTGGSTSYTGVGHTFANAGNGGGIENDPGATLTVTGVAVTANRTIAGGLGLTCFDYAPPCNPGAGGSGGGIYNTGTLTVASSTISDNTTGSGAAARESSPGGTAGYGGEGGPGGGIFNQGTMTITDTTIVGNATGAGGSGGAGGASTTGQGGDGGGGGAAGAGVGIENAGGVLTITGSTITRNTTGPGGSGGAGGGGTIGGTGGDGGYGGSGAGIDSSAELTINNSTITDNTTGGSGTPGEGGSPGGINGYHGEAGNGGALNQSAISATLSQVTIDDNTASGTGVAGGLNAALGAITIENSIIASNHASADLNCAGSMIIDAGHDLSFGDTSCPGANGDPKLGPLADNGGPTETMAPQVGSAAIDIVPTNACTLPTDQRDVSRPQGPACDAGAYEVAPPLLSGVKATASTTSTATVTADINANLQDTKAVVVYGTTTTYGSASATQDLGSGNSPAPFSVSLIGLAPSMTYHAQIVATNRDGTARSSDFAFTTPAATVKKSAAVSVAFRSIRGDTLSLAIVCHGAGKCTGSATLSSHVTTRAGKTVAVAARAKPNRIAVTVGKRSYSVPAGKRAILRISLNGTGRKLLNQFYRLPASVMFGRTAAFAKTITFSLREIKSPILFSWAFNPGFTVGQQLTVIDLPSKPKVTVICHGGGCPFATRTFAPHGKYLALTPQLGHSHFKPGTTLELEITATNRVGKVAIFTILGGRQPSLTNRCLVPGARHPTTCA